MNLSVKDFLKSVSIWRRYRQKYGDSWSRDHLSWLFRLASCLAKTNRGRHSKPKWIVSEADTVFKGHTPKKLMSPYA